MFSLFSYFELIFKKNVLLHLFEYVNELFIFIYVLFLIIFIYNFHIIFVFITLL